MELIEIQRLVDGELPKAERINLLKQADSRPEHWRTIALSFLEEQSFRDGIRSLNPSPSVSELNAIEQNRMQIESPAITNSARAKAEVTSNSWGTFALAAGVMLLVGFSFGRMANVDSSTDNDLKYAQNGSQSNGPMNSIVAIPTESQANKREDDFPFDEWGRPVGQLTFAADGSLMPPDLATAEHPTRKTLPTDSAIPIYEVKAGQAKRWLDAESQRMSAWRDTLRRQGYELDLKPQRIEKRLPDGRSLIVPVNQWNVRPFGQ